jgi:hypothetical protein
MIRRELVRLRRSGSLISSSAFIWPVRPRLAPPSGLTGRGIVSCRKAALSPVCLLRGEIDRLRSLIDAFRGSRNFRNAVALLDGDAPRLEERDLADHGEPLHVELSEGVGCCGNVGEVFSRASFGGRAGTGRGFRNLSAGFMVRSSELVELTLSFLDLPLERWKGTLRTLTSWPGSNGQEVVDGSAELWNSIESSS